MIYTFETTDEVTYNRMLEFMERANCADKFKITYASKWETGEEVRHREWQEIDWSPIDPKPAVVARSFWQKLKEWIYGII